jgi:hypothetical protein
MSTEAGSEHPLGAEIDTIFQESYGETTRGRIELAAHAISTCVNHFDILEDEQRKSYESVGSASRLDIAFRYSSAHAPVIPPENDATDVECLLGLFEENEELGSGMFSPIEKAKLALRASTDGIRAAHNLSRFQANRAIALSRKRAR